MALTTLPHVINVTTPGSTTDVYGNTVPSWTTGATTVSRRAYVQPTDATEDTQSATREALAREYRCFTLNALTGLERVAWSGMTLEVIGPSRRWDTPRGTHHYETALRIVEG